MRVKPSAGAGKSFAPNGQAVSKKALHAPADKPKGKQLVSHKAGEVRPDRVIPLDDERFKDF
jgi:hypothetical protein